EEVDTILDRQGVAVAVWPRHECGGHLRCSLCFPLGIAEHDGSLELIHEGHRALHGGPASPQYPCVSLLLTVKSPSSSAMVVSTQRHIMQLEEMQGVAPLPSKSRLAPAASAVFLSFQTTARAIGHHFLLASCTLMQKVRLIGRPSGG